VGYGIGFDHRGAVQLEPSAIDATKESDAISKEHWDEIEVYLVEKACRQVLLSHIGSIDRYVSITCDGLSLR
jgi:hypothetical protein